MSQKLILAVYDQLMNFYGTQFLETGAKATPFG
jgi:hypothetical protein